MFDADRDGNRNLLEYCKKEAFEQLIVKELDTGTNVINNIVLMAVKTGTRRMCVSFFFGMKREYLIKTISLMVPKYHVNSS